MKHNEEFILLRQKEKLQTDDIAVLQKHVISKENEFLYLTSH